MNAVTVGVRGRPPVGGGSSARWAWRAAIAEEARRVRGSSGFDPPDPASAFEVEVTFLLLRARAVGADLDNFVRPVLNTIFSSRDEQADRSLTGVLFDIDDARVERLIVEKRVVDDPSDEGVDVLVRWGSFG